MGGCLSDGRRQGLDWVCGAEKFPKLRDDVTEGYNIIPNFFISAMMNKDLKYSEGNIERRKGSELVSRQFENRLFDRDTLIVAHYDINFLFIVSLYARGMFAGCVRD